MTQYSKLTEKHVHELVKLVGGEKDFTQGNYELNGKFIYDRVHDENSDLYNRHLKNYRPINGIKAGNSPLVLYPVSTEQVSEILNYCNNNLIKVFPQGGNSGLVGGSTPDDSGDGIVLSTLKMNRILSEITENSLTVKLQAGVIIDALNQKLEVHDLFCSIKHGGTGLANIGGSIATNSGGANAIKYGITREQVVSLTAVTADGKIHHLGGTVKDNSLPVNLMHMLIGSEGILGVITEAEIKIYPVPRSFETALIGMKLGDVDKLLGKARKEFGRNIEAFEFMEKRIFDISRKELNTSHAITENLVSAEVYILFEVSSYNANDNELKDRFQQFIINNAAIIKDDHISYAVNGDDRGKLWSIREHCSDASANYSNRKGIFFDNCLPLGKVAESLKVTRELLENEFAGEFKNKNIDAYGFGHWGDGNIHYHVVQPAIHTTHFDIMNIGGQIEKTVLDYNVIIMKGSFAAEHGNGIKTPRIRQYAEKNLREYIVSIKGAIDVNNVLNPGRSTI